MKLLPLLPCAEYMFAVHKGNETSFCIYTRARGYTDERDDLLSFWENQIKVELVDLGFAVPDDSLKAGNEHVARLEEDKAKPSP